MTVNKLVNRLVDQQETTMPTLNNVNDNYIGKSSEISIIQPSPMEDNCSGQGSVSDNDIDMDDTITNIVVNAVEHS